MSKTAGSDNIQEEGGDRGVSAGSGVTWLWG